MSRGDFQLGMGLTLALTVEREFTSETPSTFALPRPNQTEPLRGRLPGNYHEVLARPL
jgi:hypothetical protein